MPPCSRRGYPPSAAGCTTLVTETGAPDGGGPGPSHRNIMRAGFTPAYVRANLASATLWRRGPPTMDELADAAALAGLALVSVGL